MNIKYILFLLFTLSLVSCSDKQLYENLQYNKKLECKRFQQSHYEDCMKEVGPSYEVYKAEKNK